MTVPTFALLLSPAACTHEPEDSLPAEKAPPPAERLVFPESTAAEDPDVNQAIREALKACLEGDYDRFRASWSAAEPPMESRKFHRHWQPVRSIEVREVQPMRHAEDGRLLFYVDAAIEFGPGAREAHRDVLFLVVRESEAWRLARAPKSLVESVRGERAEDGEQ